jgi:hypothetical protein
MVTSAKFHICHIVKIRVIPLRNILEFQEKLLLCIVNNYSQHIFPKNEKKLTHISPCRNGIARLQ